jgi:plasmid maintenance system antidote protein VapI
MKKSAAENLRDLLNIKPTRQKNIKGVLQPNVSAILHGRRIPTKPEAFALSNHFGVSVELFLEVGPIRRS